jgi:hypothetical protein
VQEFRFVNYWHMGGREKNLGITDEAVQPVTGEVTKAIVAAREEADKVDKQ